MNSKADEKRKRHERERRREVRMRAPAENCPQRILRRVVHESNLGGMTAGEVYDATVHAVMRERNLNYQDLDDVAAEMMRLEKRWRWASSKPGEQAEEISRRLDLEAGVLKWAMDEIAEMLRPGNDYKQRWN